MFTSEQLCQPISTDTPGIFRCPVCGLQNPRPIPKPFVAVCGKAEPSEPRDDDIAYILFIDNQLPQDLLSKGKRYLNERDIWKKAGKPVRSDEEIFRIFTEVCSQCEHFNPRSEKLGNCRLCGCFLKPKGLSFNKIAWSTTYCPANPPKWTAEVVVEKSEVEKSEEEVKLEQALFQNQDEKQQHGLKMREVVNHPVPPPKKKGGCCGGK